LQRAPERIIVRKGVSGKSTWGVLTVILLAARVLLAVVFALAAVMKLRRRGQTEEMLGDFGVPERARPATAVGLPLVELAVAVGLVTSAGARWAALAALLLLGAFSVAIARVLLKGERVACNCFGSLGSAPVSGWTLARNLVLAGLAAVVVVAGPGTSIGDLDRDTVIAVAAAAAGVLLVGLTWLSWELFQQGGRLVARVRALEEALQAASPPIPGPPEAVRGLRVGEPAPDVVLTGADGGTHSIRALVEAAPVPIALIFSDPACGGCRALTERLPALRAELSGVLEPVLITRAGGAAASPQLPVLIQQDREAIVAFAVGAVPAAVLLDAEGRVASRTAIGDVAVEQLLRTAQPARRALTVLSANGGVT